MLGDNSPAPADWRLPPRCCGDWCTDPFCPMCGNRVVEVHLVRGEN